MKKTFLFALGLLMGVNAWSYDNVPATFTWAVGNESAASIVSDATDGVKEAKIVVGAGLTAGTYTNYAANPGNTMSTYVPAESKPGAVATVMVEYRVKMKKGVTFTLSNASYDAIKDGTDDASYSWSYAVDGVESAITAVSKDDLLRNNNTTGTPALNHSHAITATAGQEVSFRIYVSNFANNKKMAISNIILTGTVNGEEEVRTFTDFKLDFRSNPYTVVLPEGGTLPSNVSLANEVYHDTQHGLRAGTITVDVDGPVKFTLGGCTYGTNIVVKKGTETVATIDNKSAGCDNTGVGTYTKFATWTYNVEAAATLAFTVNGYLPYFFAEACEFVPQVVVSYYDVNGTTLIGKDTVEGGSALAFKYGAADVTVAAGEAFRGWFNATTPTALKVKAGTPLTEDLKLYAKATDIEIAELGKIYDYDFRPANFYPEDHELLTFVGGSYNGTQHGWAFGNGNSISIQVAGNALLAVDVCTYSSTGTVALKDANDSIIGELTVEREVTADGSKQSIYYEGPATTLTFYFTATNYIHFIKVYNVASLPTKDEATGYYILEPGDGAGLKLVLESLQNGDKIFLPNGIYDFGEAALTQISKNNVSIIGQSMDSTIIKNTPDIHNEGISTTATLLITGENTYLQDLTLYNAMDYFEALRVMSNGRGVCLQDKGTKTICKNVRMLSNQDTYYSNKVGAVKYFEDCEIHGTVDFICGDGSVYFYGTELVCEQRNSTGGGSDAVTASNADASDKGYVFDHCSIRYAENIQGDKPVVSLGRAWNNSPKTVFLYTFLDDSNGALNMTKEASAQKDKIQRWSLGAMNALPQLFGEYNSVNAQAEVVSPQSNNVKFVLNSNEKQMETILTAEQAATYTMDYTLGSWAATAAADATQAVVETTGLYEPEGIYLLEVVYNSKLICTIETGAQLNNEFIHEGVTIRKANGRGGFGWKRGEEPQGIDNTSDCGCKVEKIIRDGQVIIIRDNKEYNVLGTQL